jgi:carboxylesterase type B
MPLNLDQEALAASMRRSWATFAASGDPSSAGPSWPSFDGVTMMSLVPPQPQVVTDFASRHHCSFCIGR